MQVARTEHKSAGFYVTATERVEVSVRRVVWHRTFVFLSDGVFVATECCGLAVGNRVLMAEVLKELRSPQMSKPFVCEEVVLHLIARVLRSGCEADICVCIGFRSMRALFATVNCGQRYSVGTVLRTTWKPSILLWHMGMPTCLRCRNLFTGFASPPVVSI